MRYERLKNFVAEWTLSVALAVFIAGCPGDACPADKLVGDAERGAGLFASGDGMNANGGCQNCHCPDASGGCQFDSPNIQGEECQHIDEKTRNPIVSHPGGKFDFSDQDIADIEAFLADLAK